MMTLKIYSKDPKRRTDSRIKETILKSNMKDQLMEMMSLLKNLSDNIKVIKKETAY
jgi:hypothetical protein